MLLLGSRLRRCFGWNRSFKAASRVLVSVYMQPKTFSYRGVSFTSRRILLTTSIWSILTLFMIFIIIYTILVVAVDKPFQAVPSQVNSARPRLRFLGRGSGLKNLSTFSSDKRQEFWDPSQPSDKIRVTPVCRHGSLLIVLITSSPDHFEHRMEIRRTWCSYSLHVADTIRWQCVFLIGQTNKSELASSLKEESRRYGDLLRGAYLDSYRNLTHKVMDGLSWVSSECEAPYVLKTDDDCFANTVLLQQFLLHHNTQTSNLYAGGMVVKEERRKVIRRPNEKWSVSQEDYLPDYYPMYASGSGYVLSFDVVTRAVEESRYVKPIPNEDAYLGILMDQIGVPPKHSGRFTLSSSGLRVCNYLYIFVAHSVAPAVHRDMSSKMLAAQRDCSSKEDVTDW